jgi:glycosyltransferase involved in cell wall biosynthesis
MKVVIIGTRGFPNVQGGVEKHCENLAVHLVRLGCEVEVFTRRPYVDENIKEFEGVRLIALPTIKHKSLEAFLHTLLGVLVAVSHRPNILHIQAIGPALFVPLARLFGMKVVLTSHGSNYEHLKWGKFARLVLRLGEFLGVTFAHRIIAISEPIAEHIKKKYGKNARCILNGATRSRFVETERTLAWIPMLVIRLNTTD